MKRKAIYLLYRVLQALASPFLLVYLVFRGIRNPRYFSTLRQRLGETPVSWQQIVPGSIWLHAVSVGEILAAIPLIEELRKRTPAMPVFVSTTTLAGRETAGRRLAGLADGIFYAPLDFVWAVRRVLRRLRPSVVVILETEIWPNLFREANRIGCGLMIVNGRISDRALPRYRKYAGLFRVVLELCDRVLAQSDEMKARFAIAGAPPEKVEAAGNLKYDTMPPVLAAESPVRRFLEAGAKKTGIPRPLWIAASTSADERIAEENFVLAAQRQLPGWRLIVAPRKPERFDAVATLLAQSGMSWTRRTALADPDADILLLDSIGELSGLFPYAQVVFMGGTLADRGGHNILEPASFGRPVIVGPHMENFRDIAADFEKHDAVLRIDSGQRLAEAVISAAEDPGLGHRSRAAAERHKGASVRAANAIVAMYDSSYPCERDPQPLHGFLWLLSRLWKAGSERDSEAKAGRAHRLPVPVISVGNVTTGGTGKTPVTIELVREFRGAGAGLLTRGYGRSASENVLVVDGDHQFPRSLTGDEAQLFLRATRVPMGIGADRYSVGEELLLAGADVRFFFLDDGFQHRQLVRDFDLVLIDALRPFGGGHLLPLGSLREPLEGLARAHAFLITRADEAPNTRAIESVLRRYNLNAPVFRARTLPGVWRDAAGGVFETRELRGIRAAAFCGLGNPQAFWKTLEHVGIDPVSRYEYPDHHLYRPAEIRRLTRHAHSMGVDVLVTTAKDAVNLDPDYPSILGDVRLYWLEIRTEIDRKAELFELIRAVALQQAR